MPVRGPIHFQIMHHDECIIFCELNIKFDHMRTAPYRLTKGKQGIFGMRGHGTAMCAQSTMGELYIVM
jgi:hypothetical protein